MAFPTTEARADTKLRRFQKMLGAYQNQAGANSQNNPSRSDGLRITLVKLLNAILQRQHRSDSGGTDVLSVSSAGTAAVNQNYNKQADGSYLSDDEAFTVLYVVEDQKWELMNIFAVVQYSATTFPVGPWSVELGSSPAPIIHYA